MSRKLMQKVVAVLLTGSALFAVPVDGCSGSIGGVPFAITPGVDGLPTSTPVQTAGYGTELPVDDDWGFYPSNGGYGAFAFAGYY